MANNSSPPREHSTSQDHVINIGQATDDRLKLMHQKISRPPRLLTKAAAKSSCCIFRVPISFVEINGKSYQPHIVSIGPYHHAQPHVKMIEEHKWRYLGNLLDRLQAKGLLLEDLLKSIEPLAKDARDCYSEAIVFSEQEFVEMMVLDGCFVIELLRKFGDVVRVEDDDPMFTMQWITIFISRDLLCLENQIPFYVLECLFDLTREPDESFSLSTLALNFFSRGLVMPVSAVSRCKSLRPRHLLDLVRSSYTGFEEAKKSIENDHPTPSHLICCVSKLRRAGIWLCEEEAESFLMVGTKDGFIGMPTITLDDAMSSFLLNCVAYEQCHNACSKHFTAYAVLLDCLVKSYKDVEYLCDRNIIENHFGTEEEIFSFIINLGKDITFDMDRCYLATFFNDVHRYYKYDWHVQWVAFRYAYFETRWSIISTLAAITLLVLTVTQTLYTVLSFYRS